MKLFNFEANNKRYCLMKLDNLNFTIREYLNAPVEKVINGKTTLMEFKSPNVYYGTLEYALRKAFNILGKDFINKKEFGSFRVGLHSLFDLKPIGLNDANVDEFRKMIKRLMEIKS